MQKKIALITGITGQDGSYLAEFLLSKNYTVHGIKRRSSSYNTDRINHLIKESNVKSNLTLHYGDVVDSLGLLNIIKKLKPDEIYNLAAQSHVAVSFESPEYTANADGLGPLRILEIIKSLKLKCKFYQASTSELFGDTAAPQNENSKLEPQSPYAAAKLYSYHITKIYRNAYGIHASNGILFNHESPRRGETFLTRKVTMGVAKIFLGKLKCIYVGNIYSKRDWGHAKEYVESMWKILNQKKSNDYVIATGRSYTVKKFIEIAFKNIGISIGWRGKGLNEVGFDKKNKDILIKISPKYFRPLEVNHLMGKSLRSHKILKWKPKIKIEELVKEMVEEDTKLLKENFNK
jgi:GDPmannose 4,6-dehydratase